MNSNRKLLSALWCCCNVILVLGLTPITHLHAAFPSSNHKTNLAALTDAGWHCINEEQQRHVLNNDLFRITYSYIEHRAGRRGISDRHLVCELGTPTLNHKAEKDLYVMGAKMVAGEQLLVFGDDISTSSTEKNVIAAILDPQGVLREIFWVTPSEQTFIGFRIAYANRKLTRTNGSYTGGSNVLRE